MASLGDSGNLVGMSELKADMIRLRTFGVDHGFIRASE
jgi:hypothetical protein